MELADHESDDEDWAAGATSGNSRNTGPEQRGLLHAQNHLIRGVLHGQGCLALSWATSQKEAMIQAYQAFVKRVDSNAGRVPETPRELGFENPDSPSSMTAMFMRIHHAAIIASDYEVSKHFYTEMLGLRVIAETWRADRRSHKLDLALPDGSQIEMFTFPAAPPRPDQPEALGLRHLAFSVENVEMCKAVLEARGLPVEPVRVDETTGKKFTFFKDPDGLPLEIYQA